MDTVSTQKRSEIMSRVKSNNNTSTELQVIKLFKDHKIKGWRRKYKIKGKPDIVFLNKKIAIFIDGCFWHGCQKHCRIPETNQDYWKKKIKNNFERDILINEYLRKIGWKVIRIWEHDVKNMELRENILNNIKKLIS